MKYIRRMKFTGFVFVLPALLYFASLYLFPVISVFFNSFFKYDLFTERIFVGLANYLWLLSDSKVAISLKATAIYMAGSCLLLWVVSFSFALMLHRQFSGNKFYRFVFFIPLVISLVVISLIWKVMFQPTGLVNLVLGSANIEWLTSTRLAIWVVVFISIWKWSGFYTVLFLSGLDGIPQEYIDAANVDGAGAFSVFRFIILPLLRPTFTFVMIISLISAAKVFDIMYIVTKGGPVGSTNVLAMRIYETAFRAFRMGRASAMSVILFFILLFLTLLQFRILDVRDRREN